MIGIRKKQSFLLKDTLSVDFGLPCQTTDLPLAGGPQLKALAFLGIQEVVFATQPISGEASVSLQIPNRSTEVSTVKNHIKISVIPTYWLDDTFEDFVQQHSLTVYAGKYVLLALKTRSSVRELKAPLFEIRARGYEPVIIHYEPREFTRWKLPALEYLNDLGCLFQLNVMTLSGFYGQKAKSQAETLLNEGLVQFFTTGVKNEIDAKQIETLMMSHNMISTFEQAIMRHMTSLFKIQ